MEARGDRAMATTSAVADLARTLALDEMAAEVISHLESRGVQPILLKGPSFARWLYGPDEHRPYVDVDVLVHPREVGQAALSLRELGYAPRPGLLVHDSSSHAVEWVHPHRIGEVDLHTALVGCALAPAVAGERLRSRTVPMLVAGQEVVVLDEPTRLVHLVLHAAQDRLQHEKKLEDLRRALQLPLASWQAAREAASDLAADQAFRAGLELLPEGRYLVRHLELPEIRDVEVILRAAGRGPGPVRFEHLRKTATWRGRAAYVLEQAWPGREVLDATGSDGWLRSLIVRSRRLLRIVFRLPRELFVWLRARRVLR